MAGNSEETGKRRRGPGRPFKPGQSGNPAGRPKTPKELVALAQAFAPEAIDAAAKIMRNRKARPADRLKAAEMLLDRGYGKAPQDINLGGQPDNPVVAKLDTSGMTADEKKALSGLLAKGMTPDG